VTRINVPRRPPLPSRAAIASALPVRGKTWSAVAELYNWCLAQGTALVPMHTPVCSWSGSGTRTLRYRAWPRHYAVARLWALQLTTGWWQIQSPTGGTSLGRPYVVQGPTASPLLFFLDSIAAPTAGEVELSLDIGRDSTGGGSVRTLGCFEVPRGVLENGLTASANTELGLLAESMTPGEQIYYHAEALANSYGGIGNTAIAIADQLGRGTLFSWASMEPDPFVVTSGSLVPVFAVPPILLASKVRAEDTVTTCAGRVRAMCSDGSTSGEVVLTMANGDTATIAVPVGATSFDWFPAAGSVDLDVHAEDVASADGRRSSTWDTCTIEARRTAGSGQFRIAGVCIGQPSQ